MKINNKSKLWREYRNLGGIKLKYQPSTIEQLENAIIKIKIKNKLLEEYEKLSGITLKSENTTIEKLKDAINKIKRDKDLTLLKQKIKRKENKKKYKRLKKQIRYRLQTPEHNEINDDLKSFLQKPEHKKTFRISTPQQLANNIMFMNMDNHYRLRFHYTLDGVDTYRFLINLDEIQNLLKILKEGGTFVQSFKEKHGSDLDIIYDFLSYGGDLTLKWFDKNMYNKTNNGSYFKYYHNLNNINLTTYQIYHKEDNIDYEQCLLYSFNMAGVKKSKIDFLKLMIFNKNIYLRDLNKIAIAINYNIIVSYLDSTNNLRKKKYIVDKKIKTIELGLIDEHYFLNEITDYTSEIFTGKRNAHNKLTSFSIIKTLYKYSKKYLTPITIENINNYEHNIKFDENYELRKLKKTEYKPYNNQINEIIFMGNFTKSKRDPNLCYKLCFVDLETYCTEKHKPYCLSYSFEKEDKIYCLYGLDCVEKFLNLIDTNMVIITHNLSFDFIGFINHLSKFQTPIETGTKLKHLQCMYNGYNLVFKDNCAFLPFKLSTLPKMFNLKSGDKDIYPYTLITKDNINDFIQIEKVLEHIKKTDKNDFIKNLKNANSYNDNLVDIKKYTEYYCNQDVNILKQSYLTFRKQIKTITDIDIISLISLPQLADEYFKKQGVYNGCFKISGVAQDFIRKCAHGGRVMTRKNKKYYIKGIRLNDFDAVSLYPSAMFRLLGYLKGIPKLLTDFSKLNSYDYYFIEILITDLKIKRALPLSSIKDSNGIKQYTNDIIGRKIIVDKITLEDLVKFQGVKYEIIRGYYFNEGFNTKIKEVIKFMFNERIKLKKAGNPLQNAYKLILNSSYGKLIQKPIKYTKKFYEGNYENYVIRDSNNIIEYQKINDNLICVKKRKSIIKHFTGCHMACQVLSMSKRIMNEVICLSEDLNQKIYYQDTDSLHIQTNNIKELSDEYKKLYNKELIGSGMGQFHTDFEVNDDNLDKSFMIEAVESIFLGKKAYIDKLEYKTIDEDIKNAYHIRMKGMNSNTIIDYYNDVMNTYKKLYNSDAIEMDMVKYCPLELKKNYTAINRESFKRVLRFKD